MNKYRTSKQNTPNRFRSGIFHIVFLGCIFVLSNVHAANNYDPYLSFIGQKLEGTTLSKISKELGETPIVHSGSIRGPIYTICYTTKNKAETVFFESGVMGGSQHQLLSYSVMNSKDRTQECAPLPAASTNLHIGVLHLGAKMSELKGKLPQPLEKIDGYGYLHKYSWKIPFTAKDIERTKVENMEHAFWTTTLYIEVFESKGFVTGYKVSKQTAW